MRFSEYFNQWLYGTEGYYSTYKTIGKEGDFFTAVSTSAFFGGSIGKRVVDIIEKGLLPKDTTIVEIGAHHGYLLADMIQFIYTLKPELLDSLNFAIVERYKHLQQKQLQYFQESFGDVIKLQHYDNISDVKLDSAFVVANEIFDAFSCELIYTNKDGIRQMGMVEDHKIKFVDCDDQYLNTICDKYHIEKGEVAIGYEEFAQTLSNNIDKFEFITFDYGDKLVRNDFSCRIYSKHNVYPLFDDSIELKDYFKQSDITYDVNFTHLIDSFKKCKVDTISCDTQLKTLVEFGIINLLEILHNNSDEKTYLKETNKVKTLLEPTGMGDRFKAAIFRKNI
jgi:SAM-dependent MidA family methyltransferase